MNNNAKKWIEALRSNLYKQGKYALCSISDNKTKKFCCLGVACDIYVKEHPEFHTRTIIDSKRKIKAYGNDLDTGILPSIIKEWLGLKTWRGDKIVNGALHSHLINMNDIQGKTFLEIADELEKNENDYFHN